jgi:hypothetical protein
MTCLVRHCARATAGLALAVVLAVAVAPAGADEEHHVGTYYPQPQTVETYEARATTLPDASRSQRLAFVTVLTNQMLSNPYPPQFAIFAKGTNAEKLIIVGLYDNAYNTIYRARALFAMLTAVARMTKLFQEYKVEELFTFFDLCKLLGFEQITITDGRDFAHQVIIK